MNNKISTIYPWIVVGLLWGVALLNYMDRQMLSTMRIPMMEDIRELESAANFGRLMAVFLWIYESIIRNHRRPCESQMADCRKFVRLVRSYFPDGICQYVQSTLLATWNYGSK